MVRLFDVISSSTGSMLLGAREFSTIGLSAFIIYDTPTEGQTVTTSTGNFQLPDYMSWKGFTFQVPNPGNANNINSSYRFTTAEGIQTAEDIALSPWGQTYSTAGDLANINVMPLSNPGMFSNQQTRGFSGYNQLFPENLHVTTPLEYLVLKQLIVRLDHVRRRYPSRFEKKYSVDELLVCVEAALVDVNLTPPRTNFWWLYSPEVTGQVQVNPMTSPGGQGVPEILFNLIVQGAIIHALITKGILEVDLNFSYSDQGIQLTYDNASHYSSWYDRMLAGYTQQKTLLKQNFRPKGLAIGTIAEFGLGWFGMINSMLDNRYNQTFYPWWTSGNSGRAQM